MVQTASSSLEVEDLGFGFRVGLRVEGLCGLGLGVWALQASHTGTEKSFSSVSLSVELLGMFSSCPRHV